MTVKQKSYKIALVSIVMILMLLSTASASRHENGNVILKTDPGMVDFLKFPACGSGCGDPSWDHSCNDKDKSCDKDNKCPPCNCPTCPDPALSLNKTANVTSITLTGNYTLDLSKQIQYTYNITNVGNVDLSGIKVYDNITSPTGMPVTTPTILAPGASTTVTAIYNLQTQDFGRTNVTNSAFATGVGSGIDVISNLATTEVQFYYPINPTPP